MGRPRWRPRPKCKRGLNGTECVFDSVSSLTLLPMGQPVNLILRNANQVPVGTLIFTLEGFFLECEAEPVNYFRSYQIKTYRNRQCRGAGSCAMKKQFFGSCQPGFGIELGRFGKFYFHLATNRSDNWAFGLGWNAILIEIKRHHCDHQLSET